MHTDPILFKPESNFVDNCYKLRDYVDDIASELSKLAYAFNATGNEKVAYLLWEKSEELESAAEAIKNICGDKVDADLKDANAMSGAILKSMLEKK